MEVFVLKIDELIGNISFFEEFGVRIKFIGDLDLLPTNLKLKCLNLMQSTEKYKNFKVNIAICYTAQHELAGCANHLMDSKKPQKTFGYDYLGFLLKMWNYMLNLNLLDLWIF